MSSRRTRLHFARLGATLLAARPALAAADGDAAVVSPPVPTRDPGSDAEVVQVRGSRAPAPDRSGASVTVLTRKTLESLPGGDAQPLAYALATQPGFVADTFGFGVHARAADGGVLYVLDGIPLLTTPVGQYGVGSFIPTRLVQSMRVMTGGFPAEYGVGLGAVVDISTRQGFGPPSGAIQLAYGTYQFFQPSFQYSQQVGKLDAFVTGSFETTNRGLDPPSISPILHDDLVAGSAFARADYELGSHDRLELITTYHQSQSQIPIDPTVAPLSQAPAGAVRGPDVYGNAPPPFVPYDANPTDAEREAFAAIAYRHESDGGTVAQVAPYVHVLDGQLLCDARGSLGPTADPGSTCSDVGRSAVHEGLSASVAWTVGPNEQWKAGAMLDVAESTVDYTSYSRDDASPLGGPNPADTVSGRDLTHTLVLGAYVQDKVTYGKWTIFPGLRADVQSVTFVGSLEPDLLLGGPSGRIGLSYAITDEIVAHAFGGYLVQLPNAIDAPVAARVLLPELAGRPIPVDLKSEEDWSGELGVAGRLWRKATVGVTGWGRLAYDQLDRQNVGETNLVASYNFQRGRALGAEVSAVASPARIVSAFANGGWQTAQGEGVASERYLFSAAELAFAGWSTLDHVQTWTGNVGFDLHDPAATTHLSGLVSYGSGLRTGLTDTLSVPCHTTFDATLRHRFDWFVHPEVAIDVLNVFDDVYAIRIGTGYVGSAYGPLRRVMVRLSVPFTG